MAHTQQKHILMFILCIGHTSISLSQTKDIPLTKSPDATNSAQKDANCTPDNQDKTPKNQISNAEKATQITIKKPTPSISNKKAASSELVTVTNRIKRTEIPHSSKWGTYTPKKFDVTLTIHLAPEKSVRLPRALLESGDIEIRCDFTFKQGLYSRSETYSEQLKLPQKASDQFDIAFKWEKPRFSLQAYAKPQKQPLHQVADS